MRIISFLDNPRFFLRAGLGLTYLYSGISIVRNPADWAWVINLLPSFVQGIVEAIGVNLFLIGQGSLEIIFGLVFISWFLRRRWVKRVAILASLEMTAIIFLVGIDPVTFRDVGLLGGLLALAIAGSRRI